MSATKKPRADSVLKTLPPERQAQIADYARDHSLKDTRAWLALDSLTTSEASLSEWLSWHSLQRQLRRNESTVGTLLEKLQVSRPDWTAAQIQSVGQSFFTALALEQQDPKQWLMIQQTSLKRDQLALDKNKFEFDATRAALAKLPQLKAISANSKLTEDQKLEQARLELFGVTPA